MGISLWNQALTRPNRPGFSSFCPNARGLLLRTLSFVVLKTLVLDSGKFESRAVLARFLGVSRVRVTQSAAGFDSEPSSQEAVAGGYRPDSLDRLDGSRMHQNGDVPS